MIDLRSDTTTLPSVEMLNSIVSAPLGDDGRLGPSGRGEDPTVNELEDLAAKLTGKEAALLFPTGTLANTTSILSYCQPGDRVLVDPKMHIYKTEKIVFSDHFGQLTPVFYSMDTKFQPNFDDIKNHIEGSDIKLLCIEDSHNFQGGTTLNQDSLIALKKIKEEYGVKVHLDGARLFNASIGSGIGVSDICSAVDSVMFCLSKGLGAPIGSLVCASKDDIKKLRELRKSLGGGMRQAGIIAAPGIVALNTFSSFLKEDHALCRDVADGLNDLINIKINHPIDTNIIMLNVSQTGFTQNEFCDLAEQKGLLIKPVLDDSVRLVFHRDVPRDSAEKVIEIIQDLDKESRNGGKK